MSCGATKYNVVQPLQGVFYYRYMSQIGSFFADKLFLLLYLIDVLQSWSKISAPLVNMIKEGCENESALLILLIFH